MDWIFIAFLIASLFHMGEEYVFPGGFTRLMKRLNPPFAPLITTPFAVIMNGLQLILYLPFSLYAYLTFFTAGLLTVNDIIVSAVLAVLYNSLPVSYLVVATGLRQIAK